MSSLLQHTKSELRRAGLFDPDADYDGEVAVQVTALMETLVAYGHSGGSLAQTLEFFNRVANHKPITPLTGEDDEWDDRSEENGSPLWQNTRCLFVFKNEDKAWIVLEAPGGNGATLGDGRVKYITFPYTVE